MSPLPALTACLFLFQSALAAPHAASPSAGRAGTGCEAQPGREAARARPAGRPRRCPHADGGGAPADARTFESLRERARVAGSLKVIVRLCVPFRPEGELSERAARLQRSRIRRSQAELTRALKGFKVSAVRRYEFTPFVAMSVDDAALARLRKLSVVADVSEDATFAPAQ